MTTPPPDPMQPGWHAQLFHPDRIAEQLQAQAKRRKKNSGPKKQ